MNNDPVLYWIGLSSIPGVGRVTFRKLVNHFGSPERALAARPEELRDVDGLTGKTIDRIVSHPWQGPAEQELAKAEAAGVLIVTSGSPAYPDLLRRAPDPPLLLYVKGSLRPEDNSAVAVVGTRKPTHYGANVTRRISRELSAAGLTVVSGLARGIDTEAHKGALSANGRTIAVLGCGIDVVYPPENKGLAEELVRSGALVSENPFGTQPESGYFPARNRIISGLARGTVIVEAAEDSGSLITAKYALDQGRKLFAVPGNIGSPASRGANSLIKGGATLVENADDILRGLGAAAARRTTATGPAPLPALTGEEATAFRCITNEAKHIDVIMKECGVAAGTLGGVLITLELKGLVKQLAGKYFVRADSGL